LLDHVLRRVAADAPPPFVERAALAPDALAEVLAGEAAAAAAARDARAAVDKAPLSKSQKKDQAQQQAARDAAERDKAGPGDKAVGISEQNLAASMNSNAGHPAAGDAWEAVVAALGEHDPRRVPRRPLFLEA
jgi:hypothetical protein